jgi:hypothetical protein
MNRDEKQTFIRQKATESRDLCIDTKIYWSRHAITALIDDGLSRIEVETALQSCEVIENYLAVHRPLPDCLVLGFRTDHSAIHAVIAVDEVNDRIFVITVYLPAKDRWLDDWRTRTK